MSGVAYKLVAITGAVSSGDSGGTTNVQQTEWTSGTISNTAYFSFDVGFVPDVVYVYFGNWTYGSYTYSCINTIHLTEPDGISSNLIPICQTYNPDDSGYIENWWEDISGTTITLGFAGYDWNMEEVTSGGSLSFQYKAVKYTA